ncbi:hypothetical protein PAPYR_6995 [Paratrimastix pyriformis]|uniref:Uncharacterized protein n=1 Tax=Paratrimastix pyriformis TaxID=342808 RepID=A0ABQ8UH62_9EUKA|nr:hypothetical protein PAPYR_6995 [Paratrimastix pyriformis]
MSYHAQTVDKPLFFVGGKKKDLNEPPTKGEDCRKEEARKRVETNVALEQIQNRIERAIRNYQDFDQPTSRPLSTDRPESSGELLHSLSARVITSSAIESMIRLRSNLESFGTTVATREANLTTLLEWFDRAQLEQEQQPLAEHLFLGCGGDACCSGCRTNPRGMPQSEPLPEISDGAVDQLLSEATGATQQLSRIQSDLAQPGGDGTAGAREITRHVPAACLPPASFRRRWRRPTWGSWSDLQDALLQLKNHCTPSPSPPGTDSEAEVHHLREALATAQQLVTASSRTSPTPTPNPCCLGCLQCPLSTRPDLAMAYLQEEAASKLRTQTDLEERQQRLLFRMKADLEMQVDALRKQNAALRAAPGAAEAAHREVEEVQQRLLANMTAERDEWMHRSGQLQEQLEELQGALRNQKVPTHPSPPIPYSHAYIILYRLHRGWIHHPPTSPLTPLFDFTRVGPTNRRSAGG